VIIQHTAAAFLQKAFGHRVDADEQLNDPEKAHPGAVVGTLDGHVQNKDGGADVEEHTVKSVLLPDLQQQVFFEESEYLFGRIQNEMSVR
jgi:hypothetical protein